MYYYPKFSYYDNESNKNNTFFSITVLKLSSWWMFFGLTGMIHLGWKSSSCGIIFKAYKILNNTFGIFGTLGTSHLKIWLMKADWVAIRN